MEYRTINLARDYPGKIDDFSKARNFFLENLDDGEYAFFVADDEEIPKMLYDHLNQLEGIFPYYAIRRIQLLAGRYVPSWNPHFEPQLCSNKVRFYGRVHEHVKPRKPRGWIDVPVIHNQPDVGASYRNPWWMNTRPYQSWMAIKKVVEVIRGR